MLESQSNLALQLLHEYGFQLSSREWAALTWTVMLVCAGLLVPNVRQSAVRVLRIAFSPKLLKVWLLYLAWIAGFIWLSVVVGLWANGLAMLTFVWSLTAGVVLVSKLPDAAGKDFFLSTAKGVISITLILEYLIALSAFAFWIEFFLQPVIALSAIVLVLSEQKEDFAIFRAACSALLVAIAVLLIVHTIRDMYISSESFDLQLHVLHLSWPILLSFWALILVYFLAIVSGYQEAFRRMSLSQSQVAWNQKLGLMLALGIRIKWIREVSRGGTAHVARSSSFRGAYRAARDIVARKRTEERKEDAYQRDLVRFAGCTETDEDRLPLDKREFRETVQALNWLYTCHSGWYSREPKGYKGDLLEKLGDDFSRQGLPKPSGISMRVSGDRQRWFAWRQTPSGQCFAIGAGGPPPDQWLYDGPNPPSDFPGRGEEWGDAAFGDARATNWID